MNYKKKILFYFILFFNGINLLSQARVEGNFSFPPEKYSEISLDISKHNIFYKYTYVYNPQKTSKTKVSHTILQVGKYFTKFTDVFTLKKDSLQKKFSTLRRVGAKEINKTLAFAYYIGFDKNIIRELKTNKIIFQGKVSSKNYEFKISKPNFIWNLQNNQKKILDYTVNKATVLYAGRKWVAWYTEDVPMSLGPYIFEGLPGLILELYDEKKNFHFIIEGIDSKGKEIYKRNEEKIIQTTKNAFFKGEKNYHERPELFIRGTVKGGVEYKKIPYNPIELIKD